LEVIVDPNTKYDEVQLTNVGETAWFLVRVTLQGLVGMLLLSAVMLLIVGRERLGSAIGYFGLLLSLTGVNLLVFYFDQFGAVVSATMQFVLLMGVILYRRRYLDGIEDDSRLH
jgi:uncharacterized protein YybS (DUF2232 family)